MFGGFPVFLTRLRLSSWCGNFKYRGHEAKCCIWEWRNLGSNFSSAIIKLIKILCYILQQTVPSEPGCRVGLMWVLSGRQAANGSQPQLLLSVSQGAREHPEAQVIPQTDSIRTSAGGTGARSPHDYVCPPLRTSGCRIKAGGVSVKVCLCGWNEEGERSPVWYEVGKSTKWAPGEVWPAEAAGGKEPIRVLRGARGVVKPERWLWLCLLTLVSLWRGPILIPLLLLPLPFWNSYLATLVGSMLFRVVSGGTVNLTLPFDCVTMLYEYHTVTSISLPLLMRTWKSFPLSST